MGGASLAALSPPAMGSSETSCSAGCAAVDEAPVEGMTGSAGSSSLLLLLLSLLLLLLVVDAVAWAAVDSSGPEAMGRGVVAVAALVSPPKVAALVSPPKERAQANATSASSSSAVLTGEEGTTIEAARTLLSCYCRSVSSTREAATARASCSSSDN